MMTRMKIELIDSIPAANTLGENVLWDDAQSCLWWTDIEARQLLRHDPATQTTQRFEVPERLCSFALTDHPDCIFAAFESGIALYWPQTALVQWLSRPLQHQAGLRLNDGRTDRQGRFWVGAMVEDSGPARADLYRFDEGPGLVAQRGGIALSNGLCWSPDGHQMYFTDSMTRTIRRYAYDPRTGDMSGGKDFAINKGPGGPDGATVDAQGFVWSAQWGDGQVIRYAPDGAIDTIVELPVSLPTCVGFGGANLDRLYVTTAQEGLDEDARKQQSQAGDVFIFQTDVRGLCDARVRINANA
jgi:sugar lactone lactonase YvrE